MLIKQISIFVENKMGRLAEITKILADNEVNIQAMSIADTTDFGILRLIVDEPKKAFDVLKSNGLTVKETEVVAISLDHTPGGLSRILQQLGENGVSIEYIYDLAKRIDGNSATVVLKLSNQKESVEVLKNIGIRVIEDEELRTLN